MRDSARRRSVWGRVAAAGSVLLLLGLALAWWASRPVSPDPFYRAALPVQSVPGTLVRAEAFSRDVPASARAWRLLYTTTRSDGSPALASALVLVPQRRSDQPLPVVAWMHGTTGVLPGCAPSLLTHPFANMPALAAAIAHGWAVVATDYAGLAADGVHGYLIGADEAHAGLDALRAAHHLDGVALANNVVVWGHSQGGHAALWAGMLAPSYAPELRLAGVAALAPASDLRALVDRAQGTLPGRIISAYLVTGYASAYPDVRLDDTVRPEVRWIANDMAGRCMAGPATLFSVAEAKLVRGSLFLGDPTVGAFGARLAQNTPEETIGAPVLIAQGATDTLVLPSIQADYVRRRCSAGQSLRYRLYPRRDHLSLVGAGSPLEADLVAWTAARFAGEPAGTGCGLP